MLRKKALLPPLGLLTLAALLPQDWRLKLINRTFQKISPYDWEDCDIVLVSGMLIQHKGIMEAIREGKRRKKIVVAGGPWTAVFAEEAVRAGADFVAVGEGEVIVPSLLAGLRENERGVIFTAHRKADLKSTPVPRYDLISFDDYLDGSIEFSRGCPFECEFCDIIARLGRKVRTKSTGQVLEELQILYERGKKRNIFFVDDNFIGDRNETKRLLSALIPWMKSRRHPFEFAGQVSLNLAKDEELMALMREAGFHNVFVGIESLEPDSLRAARKFQNVGVDMDWACGKLHKAGFQIIASCMLGVDNESPGADRRIMDFATRNSIAEVFVGILQAAPGTPFWSRLEKEGRAPFIDSSKPIGNNSSLPNFVPTRPIAEIADEVSSLYGVLYERESFLSRAFQEFLAMGRIPAIKAGAGYLYPYELRAVLLCLFRNGILSPTRLAFWKYLVKAALKFPSRFHHFIACCILIEHYSDYSGIMKDELEAGLRSLRLDEECIRPKLRPSWSHRDQTG
jgi:radical SAM superfamily enzyme YgiQ (UPF0313 family)